MTTSPLDSLLRRRLLLVFPVSYSVSGEPSGLVGSCNCIRLVVLPLKSMELV